MFSLRGGGPSLAEQVAAAAALGLWKMLAALLVVTVEATLTWIVQQLVVGAMAIAAALMFFDDVQAAEFLRLVATAAAGSGERAVGPVGAMAGVAAAAHSLMWAA